MNPWKNFIQGQWTDKGEGRLQIAFPFNGEPVATAPLATAEQMKAAITESAQAFRGFSRSPRYLRSKLLSLMARGIQSRAKEFIDAIVMEAGKPITLAQVEVTRAITTFTLASEEVKRFSGTLTPVDLDPGSKDYSESVSLWFPKGPILAIAPFNFPLNLVAHKVAPALAVGASVLLKPPPQAPGAAYLLAEVFESAVRELRPESSPEALPLGAFQVLSCSNEVAGLAVQDPRISILSFTGSASVGWMLKATAGKKKTLLELGGNATVIVHSDADLERAASRITFGAFAYAGQVCTSVQRILVHSSVRTQLEKLLIERIRQVATGDPRKTETLVGPIIDKKSRDRILSWIAGAKAKGAKVLAGGNHSNAESLVIEPTLLGDVEPSLPLATEEVFGPVALLESYQDITEAIQKSNQSKYGLHAGLFTRDAKVIHQVFQELEVGGLIVNDVSIFRSDAMPYGGIKESGLGREGVRSTMEEYSELKTRVHFHSNG